MKNINVKTLIAGCIVDLLAYATGSTFCWSSSSLIKLKSTDPEINPIGRPVTPLEESLIASLPSFGAIWGPILAGLCSDTLGRKRTLLVFSIPMLISFVILTFATTPVEFYLSRFITGVSAGCIYTVGPIYLGEIAETNSRGLLGGIMGVFNVMGMLFGFAVGPFVSLKLFSSLYLIPTALFLLFIRNMPESPFYYLIKKDELSAEKSLMRLRYSVDRKELEAMKETVENSLNSKTLFRVMFSKRSFRKALTLTTVIVAVQQLMGSIAISAYMEDIFEASGSSMSSSTSTIIVGVIQVCMVVWSTFVADKWGRRILLIASTGTCALALFPLGFYFFLKHNNTEVSQLWFVPILCIVLFFAGYNFGLNTIPWTLVGELFASDTKAIASSITSITYFASAFFMSLIFPHMQGVIGFYGVFWTCGIFSLVNLCFIFFFLPETKGKSFNDILEIMENRNCEKENIII